MYISSAYGVFSMSFACLVSCCSPPRFLFMSNYINVTSDAGGSVKTQSLAYRFTVEGLRYTRKEYNGKNRNVIGIFFRIKLSMCNRLVPWVYLKD